MKVLYVLRLNVEFPLNLCENVNRKILVINVIRIQCCLWLDFYEGCTVLYLKLGQWCAFIWISECVCGIPWPLVF